MIARAERAGVEARLLRPGEDATELARDAAARGSPALGVAGGDGSLAGVAAVAVDCDLPFVCIPFGTRNHFADDLGLDSGDPLQALAAFKGREVRVDVGVVDGRVFLNNVALGLYGSLVHDPDRVTKNRVVAALRLVPAAFGRSRRPLEVSLAGPRRPESYSALVLVVANNDYNPTQPGELTRRSRLDEGLLHAYVVEAITRRRLLALLARAALGRAARAEGWRHHAAPRFRVDFHRPRVHAAIDGEPVVLEPPLELASRPRVLRVLVPPSEE